MDREQALRAVFKDIDENKQSLISEVIENVVFLEKSLTELKKLPHIKINPADSSLQKRTEAGKLYKEYLQQYTNCIKLLSSALNKDLTEEDEFSVWLKEKKSES